VQSKAAWNEAGEEWVMKMIRTAKLCLAAAIGVSLLSVAHGGSVVPTGMVNLPVTGGKSDEAGYSALGQINRETIGRMGLAWSLDLPGEVTLEARPLAVDGTLYFTGTRADIYAVNALTGKILWKYDAEVWKHSPEKMHFIFPLNRGCAYDNGRIFSATTDGRLLALDARTGKLLWSVETIAPGDNMRTVTGAPRVFNGKVIIGNGGGDVGLRGYVTAYDQQTGKQLWRFYTVPGSPDENKGDPAMEAAAKTWTGEYWKTGTGGTAWDGITFDPELNRIYVGTGNSGPYDPEKRSPGGGDNLYLTSIVALDADTGKYVWHYQMNPREAWDYKATANIVAATLTIDGKPRKVLMQAPTNGFFYVLDRETGKLISAEKLGKVTWADRIDIATGRPVERPNIRFETGETVMWPSVLGMHNWQPMSFNPGTGLAYIPTMQLGMKFTRSSAVFSGVLEEPVFADARDGKGSLVAWDPVAQKARWKIDHDWIWNGGTLTTAGNLVFQGTADGYLSAYDGATGQRLWHYNAGLGIVAAPISYAVNGTQYVAVLVGYAGPNGSAMMNVGWKFGAQPRRLLVFRLDGKATLPPTAPPDLKVHALDDPSLVLNPADIEAGRKLFPQCQGCHGANAESAGSPGPDLRESAVALDRQALWTVLHQNTLLDRGMPPFDHLTEAQVGQLHAFIRSRAREVLKPGSQPKPSSSGINPN
jgi:quinohemoprotein ethanol dehydrogenase